MRKSRYSEIQIIGMFKEQEAGMSTVDVCSKHGRCTGMEEISHIRTEGGPNEP